MNQNERMEIARTIHEQLGAQVFDYMVGARLIVAIEDEMQQAGLQLSFPAALGADAEHNWNKCRVIYNSGPDTYTMTFFRVDKRAPAGIRRGPEYTGLYAEDLQRMFTHATGLQTSLGTLGQEA